MKGNKIILFSLSNDSNCFKIFFLLFSHVLDFCTFYKKICCYILTPGVVHLPSRQYFLTKILFIYHYFFEFTFFDGRFYIQNCNNNCTISYSLGHKILFSFKNWNMTLCNCHLFKIHNVFLLNLFQILSSVTVDHHVVQCICFQFEFFMNLLIV